MLQYLYIDMFEQSLKKTLTKFLYRREGYNIHRKAKSELSKLSKPEYIGDEKKLNDWDNAGTEQDFGTSKLYL